MPATDQLPAHIAIIMDGNGRWAKARNKPRVYGHKQGVAAVRKVVEHCAERGVGYLTLFAFSSENWNRPPAEVKLLLELLVTVLETDLQRLHNNGIKLNIIGDLSAFSKRIQKKITAGLTLTENNTNMTLTIAINYGGRWDVMQASKRIATEVAAGHLQVEDLDERRFNSYLATHNLPDPDLLVRTGGEQRISNFLLWQAAYAEYYFTDCYWPDFDQRELDLAITGFSQRQRRYGKTDEQIDAKCTLST